MPVHFSKRTSSFQAKPIPKLSRVCTMCTIIIVKHYILHKNSESISYTRSYTWWYLHWTSIPAFGSFSFRISREKRTTLCCSNAIVRSHKFVVSARMGQYARCICEKRRLFSLVCTATHGNGFEAVTIFFSPSRSVTNGKFVGCSQQFKVPIYYAIFTIYNTFAWPKRCTPHRTRLSCSSHWLHKYVCDNCSYCDKIRVISPSLSFADTHKRTRTQAHRHTCT